MVTKIRKSAFIAHLFSSHDESFLKNHSTNEDVIDFYSLEYDEVYLATMNKNLDNDDFSFLENLKSKENALIAATVLANRNAANYFLNLKKYKTYGFQVLIENELLTDYLKIKVRERNFNGQVYYEIVSYIRDCNSGKPIIIAYYFTNNTKIIDKFSAYGISLPSEEQKRGRQGGIVYFRILENGQEINDRIYYRDYNKAKNHFDAFKCAYKLEKLKWGMVVETRTRGKVFPSAFKEREYYHFIKIEELTNGEISGSEIKTFINSYGISNLAKMSDETYFKALDDHFFWFKFSIKDLNNKNVMKRKIPFEEVVGNNALVSELKELCLMLKDENLLKDPTFNVPSGLLFYGEDGNGKTLMAREFIKMLDVPVLVIRPSSYLDETIEKDFKKLQKYKFSVIFVDDICDVSGNDAYFESYLKFNIEEFLEGKTNYFLVITTNEVKFNQWEMTLFDDEGYIERRDRRVFFGPFVSAIEFKQPNAKQREAIYRFYGERNGLKNIDYAYLAQLWSNVTYNEAIKIIKDAVKRKGQAATEDDIKTSFKLIKIYN